MDDYLAGLARKWLSDDAVVSAHFVYYSRMLQNDAALWILKGQKTVRRIELLLGAVYHVEMAIKRFETLKKDHEYWAKRWSAIHISELGNEARGVVMVPLLKEGQLPKKV